MIYAPDVQVGQVWLDYDARLRRRLWGVQRLVRVVEIVDVDGMTWPYAKVVTSLDGGKNWGSRQTRIRIRRFRPTSTGYKLVEETR
jgi:hypothetical protein